MLEIFKIKNVSTGVVELIDFGLKIPPELILDLGNFDQSAISNNLDFYLQRGDIVRYIDGSIVSYSEAYTSTTPIYNFDTSTDWKPYTDSSLLNRDASINKLFAQDITINASFGFYATNASIGLAGFLKSVDLNPYATNSSVGLAIAPFATNVSVNTALGAYATNASVNIYASKTDASIIALRTADLAFATNASIGLAGFLKSADLNPYATNASVGLALGPYATNASVNLVVTTINASLNNRVRITGDIMTGNLTVPSLISIGDVSFNSNLDVSGKIVSQLDIPGQSLIKLGLIVNKDASSSTISNFIVKTLNYDAIDVSAGNNSLMLMNSSLGKLGFFGSTPAVQTSGFSATNGSGRKTIDVSKTNPNEIVDLLATLINELKAKGLIG